MMTIRMLLVALVALVTLASPAAAQRAWFSAGGGWMLPTGDYTRIADAGWQVMGTAEWTIPHTPLGLRADGMYGQNGSRCCPGKHNVHVATANLILYTGAPMVPLRLYLLAGVGYNFLDRLNRTELNPVFAGGTGLSVGSGWLKAFVEGRFASIRASGGARNFFPVTAGLSFGTT